MTPPLQPELPPLRIDGTGAIRVGDSHVLLDTVVEEFREGADPDTIVREYPTLRRADVYAAIAYYLRHEQEVGQYLRGREEEAERLRQEIEARQPDRPALRAKLLARRARQDQGHAAP